MNNPLLEQYKPKSFCADLMEIKGNGLQLGLYMSLILGFKPLLDDWIRKNKIEAFKKACRGYGVHVRESVIFRNVHKSKVPDSVIDKDRLTTTSAYGLPLETDTDEEVHVFLSKDKNILKRAMWYPVIINNRVIFAPRADHLKYGYVLGYPDCCIRFFRKYNDWIRYSHLYETYRQTKTQPSFLCNPLLKDTIFSYIYHMPCRYDCQATIKLAGKLRHEILKKEPEYVRKMDGYLKKTFLVFYERKFYALDEAVFKNDVLHYKQAAFVSHDATRNEYGEDLDKASALKLHGRQLTLLRGRKVLKDIMIPLNTFAPEHPFLITFQ